MLICTCILWRNFHMVVECSKRKWEYIEKKQKNSAREKLDTKTYGFILHIELMRIYLCLYVSSVCCFQYYISRCYRSFNGIVKGKKPNSEYQWNTMNDGWKIFIRRNSSHVATLWTFQTYLIINIVCCNHLRRISSAKDLYVFWLECCFSCINHLDDSFHNNSLSVSVTVYVFLYLNGELKFLLWFSFLFLRLKSLICCIFSFRWSANTVGLISSEYLLGVKRKGIRK